MEVFDKGDKAEDETEGQENKEKDRRTAPSSADDTFLITNLVGGPSAREEGPSAEEKRFMLFISGGYKDSAAERRSLVENVYPRLFLFCKQRGYDFRMIDLRDGVETPSADGHDTAELHVENLRRCQETKGPNFILFVGQKYEVRSLPSTISKETFEAMVGVLRKDQKKSSSFEELSENGLDILTHESFKRNDLHFGAADERSRGSSCSDEEDEDLSLAAESLRSPEEELKLLQMWFRVDENCRPPVYCLLPISSHHPDWLSPDGERRQTALKEWSTTCLTLWGVIQHSAAEALGEEEAGLLLKTVMDHEVEAGLQSVDGSPPEDHCHCYKRIITDLHLNMRNKHISQCADVLKEGSQLDPVLNKAHQKFMERLHKKLRHTNIYERRVGFGQKGLNPKHNRSYQFYIQRTSSHFERTVINSIRQVMKVDKTAGPPGTVRREDIRAQIEEQIQLHVRHGLQLADSYTMRQPFLGDVKKAMLQSRGRPVLLLGPPGWGKSTTIAAAARLASSWIPGDVKVSMRFCGFTGESRNIRLVLQSLCVQLTQTYRPNTPLSEGLPQLISEFHSLLDLVTAERPLVVMLDGLDELSEEHSGDVCWISTPVPPNVYLILSAATDSPCVQSLQSTCPTVLTLPPLSPDEISAALKTKLDSDGRRLQEHQFDLLFQACVSCPCPLYMESAYSESRLWTSYTPQMDLSLPHSLQGLYIRVLTRLETELGQQLVRRVASLISISRCGVTEEELLDLLSRDERVLHEVASSHPSSSPPRVPYILLARLKHHLNHHLTEVRTDGMFVHRWTHSELSRVCASRYLNTEDALMSVHADFASYYREETEHTHIFQPLAWTLEEEEEGGGVRRRFRFNLRKLHGLSYHLVRSGQALKFLSECVFNYKFLLHKAWGLSVLEVEEDLKKAVLPDTELVDVEMLSAALEMSRSVLLQDPCQLASQLLGRLGRIVTEDRPVAKGDPLKFSYLHDLLDQCRKSSLPVLTPSSTCLLPPGELQHTPLAGHLTGITALGAGQRGSLVVTSESDGSLMFWDLDQRKIIKNLDPAEGVVADSVTLGLDDTMLIVCMRQSLQVREAESGRVMYSENDSLDVPIVTTTDEGKLLVVFYDGSDRVKVFDLSSCSLLHSLHISLERKAIHKDRSVLLSKSSTKDYVLFAYRSGAEAGVLSARGGALLSVLSAQLNAASVQAVETTEDYLLLFCRYPYKSGDEIIHIELFSPVSFLFLRSILGCSQDHISQVCVSREGSHVVAFCPSTRTGLTELLTWNLETEGHKHITRCPAVLTGGVCLDLRTCVGFCRGDKNLLLWDPSSSIRDQTLIYNVHKPRRDGTKDLLPVGRNCRYAVCLSARPGLVSVWNLSRPRYSSGPIRVHHGLYSSSDVVLIQDFRLHILTDRSTNRGADCFQTVLVYDLMKKSYVRRQTGLSVVVCPQQDYRLLQDGRTLLGLSEIRDHVILWDLESGSIKQELKPTFRETLRLQTKESPHGEETLMLQDVRTESRPAREKCWSIEKYILSGDQKVLVCSYFAGHLTVFSVQTQDHTHTLQDQTSVLSLHTAAVTHTGSHLVLPHYDQEERAPRVTLWDLHMGTVSSSMKVGVGVCCVALSGDALRVIFGVSGSNSLEVWEPLRRSCRSICGHRNLKIRDSSELHLTESGDKAVLLSDDLSLWDVDSCSLISVLSLDSHVSCMKLLPGPEVSVLLGLSHSQAVVSVKLTPWTTSQKTECEDPDLFGESSSSEEEEEEEEDL